MAEQRIGEGGYMREEGAEGWMTVPTKHLLEWMVH